MFFFLVKVIFLFNTGWVIAYMSCSDKRNISANTF